VQVYDDDLKLFLIQALRRVDYLTNVKLEILAELAFSMVGEIREKDSVLYSTDESREEQ